MWTCKQRWVVLLPITEQVLQTICNLIIGHRWHVWVFRLFRFLSKTSLIANSEIFRSLCESGVWWKATARVRLIKIQNLVTMIMMKTRSLIIIIYYFPLNLNFLCSTYDDLIKNNKILFIYMYIEKDYSNVILLNWASPKSLYRRKRK